MLSASEINEQGILWYKSGNYTEAKKCWETASDRGNASAMFCLGILFLSSECNNVDAARKWFEKADRAGHKNAKYQLECLNEGIVRSYMADKVLFDNPSDIYADSDIETVRFGNYDWIVLDKNKEKSLYLSKYIIDIRKYHNSKEAVTWERSDIRQWLNSEFYSEFSEYEKSCICDSLIINSKNPDYYTDEGKETFDKCFLLSYEDVLKYFTTLNNVGITKDLLSSDNNNYSLIATVNMSLEKLDAAHRRSGLNYSMVNGQTLGWWLRTPGENMQRVVRINCNGAIRLHGREVNRNLVGVRPAIWKKNYE